MLFDHAWSGQPAFLVAGGPSLKSFDFSLLRGVQNVLAVNVAFMDCPTAAVMLSEDARVFTRFAKELQAFKGEKVFACPDDAYVAEVKAVVPDATIIHTRPKSKGWSKSMADGLSTSQSSVVPALNLLDILDASPIYLLGIDCNRSDAGNFHTRYPKDWNMGAAQLDSIASDLTHWAAPNLRHRNIQNLNKESAVQVWWRSSLGYNDAVHAALKARDRMLALEPKDTVYLLRAGDAYKIGYTSGAVEKRIKSLQTGCASKIECLGTMHGTVDDERALHRQYAAYRVEGEWFMLPPVAVDEILRGMQRTMPVVFG